PNRKLAPGTVLSINGRPLFTVIGGRGKDYRLQPHFPLAQLLSVLDQYGDMPLPPYMKDSPLSREERREKYQAVFAENPGSIAAPTASLHFTNGLLKKIKSAGHDIEFVTLHVNLGTFAPLTDEHLEHNRLHQEIYDIPPQTAAAIEAAKRAGRPIIAVGTTVVRTLETAALASADGKLVAGSGTTELFIRPGFEFRIVDHLITNFHVPRSSLLMLVAALTGREKLFELSREALDHHYKFLSFG